MIVRRSRVAVGLATILLSAGALNPACASVPLVAQLTLPTSVPEPAVTGLVASGIYDTAPVSVDGSDVLRLGALANAPVTQLPIAMRIADVQTTLAEVLAKNGTGADATTEFDPKSLRVHVKREGDVAVLEAIDAKHSDPLPLVTVTSIDAQANGAANVDALAAQWQTALQSALGAALELRQPATERQGLREITNVSIGLIVLSGAVIVLLRVLRIRIDGLEAEIAHRARAAQEQAPQLPEEPGANQQRRRFFAIELRNLEPESRLRILGAILETLMWGLGLGWFIAITWGLSLFAPTTPLAQTLTHGALAVAATVVVTGLVNRALDIIIERTAGAWRLRRFGDSEDRARLLLRIPTIARTISGAKTVVLIFIAILSVLGQVGVPIGSVVTIGGLAAIALSLAAQNFVRDFLNGFLVLLEDQYVVGDYVTINAFSGSVERLTLRMVQIRDAAGDLITVPHSAVITVVNGSRNWSRIDYRVAVDTAADVDAALALLQSEIEALLRDGDWTAGISAPIEWIGIDALDRDGVTLRVAVKTAPLRQFELRRRINARVRSAFAKAGIALGTPAVPT